MAAATSEPKDEATIAAYLLQNEITEEMDVNVHHFFKERKTTKGAIPYLYFTPQGWAVGFYGGDAGGT